MVKPTLSQLKAGAARYDAGERPWLMNFVDWHIILDDGIPRPLKYVYGLATDIRPSTYNTNQLKAAMRHLNLPYISFREQSDEAREFAQAVNWSLADPMGRSARLSKAPAKPVQYCVVTRVFRRNPDVVAAALDRANGSCESCRKKAPFNRAVDGRPYLEVHHCVQLAHGGDDTLSNAIALCPNCHRKMHHG